MTVKLSVSLPDDVGEWLARQPNTSAAVAAAVRARMEVEESSRSRRRRKAESYVRWSADRGGNRLDELDAATADMSLRGGEW
jgi:hypothetical protein